MGSLSQAKTMGGIGAILTLLLFVPNFIGAILVIVGWILILLAVKDISEAVQDRSIFNNTMISAILAIVGTVVFAVVVVGAILGFIGLGAAGSTAASSVFGLIAGLIAGLVVGWVLLIVSAYFLWSAFKAISAKTNVGLFGTAALIYFIGAILTVIIVGFLLLFVAQILFVVAFFSLPDNPPQPQPMGPSQAPPPMTTT
jgi:uncharacterized membrane protein